MTRIYRYVLKNDSGMAPNPRKGLLTLATCKPEIRKRAKVGDWVMANYPSPQNKRVAWVGKIERCVPVRLYASEFSERDDALHEIGPHGEPQRIQGKHEWYHQGTEERRKDRSGNVLVFDMRQCWYFGADGRSIDSALKHLIAYGQGHRVKNRKSGDLNLLKVWLTKQDEPGIHAEPRDGWAGPEQHGCKKGRKRFKKQKSC